MKDWDWVERLGIGIEMRDLGLPDNCAPYVIIYTGAQLSGSGAQLSGPGQGYSCRGQGRSCRQYWYAYLHTSYPRPCVCTGPRSTLQNHTIFWVAVMRWSAAFLFRELKKVDFSTMRLSGRGMVMWFRTLAESVVGIKIDHGVTLEGPVTCS